MTGEIILSCEFDRENDNFKVELIKEFSLKYNIKIYLNDTLKFCIPVTRKKTKNPPLRYFNSITKNIRNSKITFK